jgi:hypothetical protein
MPRKPGWNGRLVAAINAFRRQPFQYGSMDCFRLVTASYEAITGEKFGKLEWHAYTDEASGLAALKAEGFADLAAVVASVLPEIHPSQAALGDIAAIPSETAFGYALGVVSGARIFVFSEAGLSTVDLLTAKRAFRVA